LSWQSRNEAAPDVRVNAGTRARHSVFKRAAPRK